MKQIQALSILLLLSTATVRAEEIASEVLDQMKDAHHAAVEQQAHDDETKRRSKMEARAVLRNISEGKVSDLDSEMKDRVENLLIDDIKDINLPESQMKVILKAADKSGEYAHLNKEELLQKKQDIANRLFEVAGKDLHFELSSMPEDEKRDLAEMYFDGLYNTNDEAAARKILTDEHHAVMADRMAVEMLLQDKYYPFHNIIMKNAIAKALKIKAELAEKENQAHTGQESVSVEIAS